MILFQQPKAVRLKKENRKDLVALFVFFAVFSFILLRLPYGVGITDEGFYYTVVQRILRGDRLIADEWQITQLNSLLEIIPYKLSLFISGGTTEGLILHVRYLFVFSQLLLGFHLWRRLRQFGYPALFFILAICTFGPHYTFVYYNMALNGAVLICTELFAVPKPASRLKLVGLGIVAALVVLSELLLTFAYVGYTLQVLKTVICRKRGKLRERQSIYSPTVRTWLWMTVGIVLTASAFFVYLMTSYHWDIRFLLDSIPNMFTDYEYNYSLFGENSHLLRVPTLIVCSPLFFGFAVVPLALATLVYAARRRKKGITGRQKRGIFLLSTLLVALAYLRAIIMCFVLKKGQPVMYYVMISGFALPIMLHCAILLLICKRPHPRWFAFWQTGLVLSLLVDITSDACLAYGGVIALLPTAVLVRDISRQCYREWRASLLASHPELTDCGAPRLLREGLSLAWKESLQAKTKNQNAKNRNKKNKNKKTTAPISGRAGLKEQVKACGLSRFLRTEPAKMTALAVVCTAAVLFVSFWVAENLAMRTMNPFVERFAEEHNQREPMDNKIESGPLKGIRTTGKVRDIYDRMMRDADRIKATSDGPLYIDSRCPVPYLQADLPVGNYSTWYVEEDNPERVLYYWRLYPERIPGAIYVPYYEATDYRPALEDAVNEKLERLRFFFDCEEEEGEAGRILYIRGVKTLEWNGDAPQGEAVPGED